MGRAIASWDHNVLLGHNRVAPSVSSASSAVDFQCWSRKNRRGRRGRRLLCRQHTNTLLLAIVASEPLQHDLRRRL